jgi:hypothetical protein
MALATGDAAVLARVIRILQETVAYASTAKACRCSLVGLRESQASRRAAATRIYVGDVKATVSLWRKSAQKGASLRKKQRTRG